MQTERINRLVQMMIDQNLSDILISDPLSIKYYLDYENDPGERFYLLKINQDKQIILFLNRLFPIPSFKHKDINIIWYNDGEKIIDVLNQQLSGNRIGIDKFWHSHFLLDLLKVKPNLVLVNGSELVDYQRSLKTEEEQEIMAEASKQNDQVMEKIINQVKHGFSEKTMVNYLSEYYQEAGSEGFSFDPIIAYGPNGADPHHDTNEDTPKVGDTVIIDIGAFYKGYASDMTRTVFYGKPSDEALKVYNIVRKANEEAIKKVKPGIKFSEIDLTARNIIDNAGYGQYFTHRLGHFIGQEAHEAGDVSMYNHKTAEIGQVFSIEPGIYLPGKLGVRIEDLVIVTKDGCRVLNNVSKEAIIIDPE